MKNNYDEHGNAKHYDDQRINVIHQMEAIWGTTAVQVFCEMNAFKYRMRLGKKDATELELKKINWYETMAKYLKKKNTGFTGFPAHIDIPLDNEFLKMLKDEL